MASWKEDDIQLVKACGVINLVLLLVLLWLVWQATKGSEYDGFSCGLQDLTATNLGIANQLRSDGAGDVTFAGYGSGGRDPFRARRGMSIGGYEPPVYFPAGNSKLLDMYEQDQLTTAETNIEVNTNDTVDNNARYANERAMARNARTGVAATDAINKLTELDGFAVNLKYVPQYVQGYRNRGRQGFDGVYSGSELMRGLGGM